MPVSWSIGRRFASMFLLAFHSETTVTRSLQSVACRCYTLRLTIDGECSVQYADDAKIARCGTYTSIATPLPRHSFCVQNNLAKQTRKQCSYTSSTNHQTTIPLFHDTDFTDLNLYCIRGTGAVCFSFFFWLRVLDKAEYSAFESTLNSSIVSYRIVLSERAVS